MLPVIQMILNIALIIVAVALIVLVLAQQGKQAGLSGSIAGGAETFFGKKKAKSMDLMLQRLTKICAVVFIVLAIVMVVLQKVPIASLPTP